MKKFTKKSFVQKTILALILVMSFNFIAPQYAYCADFSVGGSLLKEFVQLVAAIGDVVTGGLNNFMLGAEGLGSSMLEQDSANLEDPDSWLYAKGNVKDTDKVIEINHNDMDEKGLLDTSEYQIPNMLYSPENIFANNIAALDINFLRPNNFESAISDKSSDEKVKKAGEKHSESAAGKLNKTIAKWYKAFRNISIVGLLSVLVYLGIRILIGSTASDKAKYKESLKDWFVALCLVFVIHFIMSGILMLTDVVTGLFDTSINEGIVVEVKNSPRQLKFRTNIMGLIRFKAQSEAWQDATVYTIIYIALIIYTVIFTFMYLKRFLYMAFFTMIAPLVSLTYPIDRAGDGKAQAFNLWFKEYTMNVIIQPVHLILYAVFVGSAFDLAIDNPLYALVSIGFLIPAEKFIKKMFGLDKAESTSGFGTFAGGAMTMSALKNLGALGSGKKTGKESNSGSSNNITDGDTKDSIWMPKKRDGMSSFNQEEEGEKQNIIGGKEESPNIIGGEEESPNIIGNQETNPNEVDNASNHDMTENNNTRLDGNNDEYGNYEQLESDYRKSGYSEDEVKQLMGDRYTGPQQEQRNGKPAKTSRIARTKDKLKPYGRLAVRGAKSLAPGVYKASKALGRGALKATGLAAGATIGMAAGITTGDPSKVFSYGVGGAMAGKAIGNNLSKVPGALAGAGKGAYDNVSKTNDNIRNAIYEEKYGYDYARKVRQEEANNKARKNFLKNKDEKAKYRELAGKLTGYNGSIEDIMNIAADYKQAGITDDKLIENAIKKEHENGGVGGKSHDKFVDVASFATEKGFGKEYIEDEKKRRTLEATIKGTVKGEKNQKEVMGMFADLYDSKPLYNQIYGNRR